MNCDRSLAILLDFSVHSLLKAPDDTFNTRNGKTNDKWFLDLTTSIRTSNVSLASQRLPQHLIWVIDQVGGQAGWILAEFFCVFMDRDEVVRKLDCLTSQIVP